MLLVVAALAIVTCIGLVFCGIVSDVLYISCCISLFMFFFGMICYNRLSNELNNRFYQMLMEEYNRVKHSLEDAVKQNERIMKLCEDYEDLTYYLQKELLRFRKPYL